MLGWGEEKSIPCRLPKIGSLSRRLEKQPLLREILLRCILIAQFALLVVRVNQVLEDGTALPELDICVGILDCGDTALEISTEEIKKRRSRREEQEGGAGGG